jgi:hypothetical protein
VIRFLDGPFEIRVFRQASGIPGKLNCWENTMRALPFKAESTGQDEPGEPGERWRPRIDGMRYAEK